MAGIPENPFDRYVPHGINTVVGTGAGLKLYHDKVQRNGRRETRRIRLKETKDVKMFISGALEDGQSREAIIQDLETTEVIPNACENVALAVNKHYTVFNAHVPFVGNLGYGQEIWDFALIQKTSTTTNKLLNESTSLALPIPRIKSSSTNGQYSGMASISEYLIFTEKNNLKNRQEIKMTKENLRELSIINTATEKGKGLNEQEQTISVGIPTKIIAHGSFIRQNPALTQNLIILGQFFVFYVVVVPILGMVQRFVQNSVFPKIPVLKNFCENDQKNYGYDKNPNLNNLRRDFMDVLSPKDKTNDIIFLLYLLDKNKITKKEAFVILKNKYNLDDSTCQNLLVKKEGLVESESEILSDLLRFYKPSKTL